jgi:hypothetical protein
MKQFKLFISSILLALIMIAVSSKSMATSTTRHVAINVQLIGSSYEPNPIITFLREVTSSSVLYKSRLKDEDELDYNDKTFFRDLISLQIVDANDAGNMSLSLAEMGVRSGESDVLLLFGEPQAVARISRENFGVSIFSDALIVKKNQDGGTYVKKYIFNRDRFKYDKYISDNPNLSESEIVDNIGIRPVTPESAGFMEHVSRDLLKTIVESVNVAYTGSTEFIYESINSGFDPKSVPNGSFYNIITIRGDNCLGVRNGSQNFSAEIYQSKCSGSDDQKLQFLPTNIKFFENDGSFQIQIGHSSKCVDFVGVNSLEGYNTVIQHSCDVNHPKRSFRISKLKNGNYYFVNRHNQKVLRTTEKGDGVFLTRLKVNSNSVLEDEDIGVVYQFAIRSPTGLLSGKGGW